MEEISEYSFFIFWKIQRTTNFTVPLGCFLYAFHMMKFYRNIHISFGDKTFVQI
jgi:hypothetical protein